MKKSELIFSTILIPVDFFMLIAAGLVSYFLRTNIIVSFRPVFFDLNLPFERYIVLVVIVAIIFMIMYALSGLYYLRTTRSTLQEFARVAIASSAGIMTIIVYIFLRQELFDSRFLVLGFWILAIFFVSFGRVLVKYLQRFLVSRYSYGVHRVLIIGDDATSSKMNAELKKNPALGYRVIRHLQDPAIEEVSSVMSISGLDEVILANPNYASDRVLALIDFCNHNHLAFKFVPNMYQALTANFAFDTLTGVPIIELKRTALDGWGHITKMIIDKLGSFLGLIILSPLFLIIAICIKWESDGPVFVELERTSRNRLFKLYKFRSMIKNAEEYKKYLLHLNERKDSPLFKMRDDPRVTRVGSFLRKYRLDELPQLSNVLKGDISLVGPRPHQPDEIALYQNHHRRVLAIKAGITGLAQISGSSDLPFEEEVALDTYYIENWSLWQDARILILTILKLVRDRSAV